MSEPTFTEKLDKAYAEAIRKGAPLPRGGAKWPMTVWKRLLRIHPRLADWWASQKWAWK